MKKILLSLILVLGIFVLSSCEKKEDDVIKYVGVKIYDPVYVAIDAGIFEKNGVKVELVNTVAGGPNALQIVAGGSAQASLSAIMGIVNAVNAGLSVLGVSDLQSSLDDQPLKEFFVLPDSDIESVKDLKGKRIAINAFGGSFYYSWIIELEKQGLKESDVTFVSLPFPEQITALENDQVDVVSLMVPHNSIAKQRGLRLLMDANDIFKSKQFSLHFINSEWGKDNPEIAERFVKSIAEAIRFIYENPVTSKSIISKYTGISVDLIPDYKFQKFGMVIEEDVVFWLNFMKDRTDITINPLLKYQDIATNKYNPFADRGEK